MYRVIKYFTDLNDGNHAYNVGDIYPRKDLKVSEDRIKLLSSSNNLQGQPLIEKVEEVKVEKVEKPKADNKKKPIKK